MNFSYYRKQVSRFGYKSVAYELCIRALEKLAPYHEYVCLNLRFTHSEKLKKNLKDLSGFEFKELSLKTLTAHANENGLDLPISFLTSLESRTDVCFGLYEKKSGRLACYSFFSTTPTEVHSKYFFKFPEKWIYVYKAFTHSDFRGKGLLPFLLNQAIANFEKNGAKGYLTLIQAHNLSSLKAFSSLGFDKVQSFHMFKMPGKPWSLKSFSTHDEGLLLFKAE